MSTSHSRFLGALRNLQSEAASLIGSSKLCDDFRSPRVDVRHQPKLSRLLGKALLIHAHCLDPYRQLTEGYPGVAQRTHEVPCHGYNLLIDGKVLGDA